MTKRQLQKLIRNFKPEFGNERHIRALSLMKKFDKKDELMRKKKGVAHQITTLNDEIDEEGKHLLFLMG